MDVAGDDIEITINHTGQQSGGEGVTDNGDGTYFLQFEGTVTVTAAVKGTDAAKTLTFTLSE